MPATSVSTKSVIHAGEGERVLEATGRACWRRLSKKSRWNVIVEDHRRPWSGSTLSGSRTFACFPKRPQSFAVGRIAERDAEVVLDAPVADAPVRAPKTHRHRT